MITIDMAMIICHFIGPQSLLYLRLAEPHNFFSHDRRCFDCCDRLACLHQASGRPKEARTPRFSGSVVAPATILQALHAPPPHPANDYPSRIVFGCATCARVPSRCHLRQRPHAVFLRWPASSVDRERRCGLRSLRSVTHCDDRACRRVDSVTVDSLCVAKNLLWDSLALMCILNAAQGFARCSFIAFGMASFGRLLTMAHFRPAPFIAALLVIGGIEPNPGPDHLASTHQRGHRRYTDGHGAFHTVLACEALVETVERRCPSGARNPRLQEVSAWLHSFYEGADVVAAPRTRLRYPSG